MVDYVDVQYATQLASRFPRSQIKQRNPLKINFRCPICNDSQKSKTKARGWITEIQATSHLHYSCFNCGVSLSFDKFAKQVDPQLHNDYVMEKYAQKLRGESPTNSIDEKVKTPPPNFNKKILTDIKKISQLKHDHPAKLYIENRKIPANQHWRIYYAPKFMTWINSIIPNKFDNISKDEPRLVIPLFDKKGNVLGVSARSFNPKSLRYITIMFRDVPKIFGLDKVNFGKTYFVTEGAIDSMFLTNSVAMVGADIRLDGLENVENAVFVHDAEPRNKEIVRRMDTLLKRGYKVCIWPSNIRGKDINEMVLLGAGDVEKIVKENTYNGLYGQLKLKDWKSVDA